jgi:hypothetical protein
MKKLLITSEAFEKSYSGDYKIGHKALYYNNLEYKVRY